MPLTRRMPPHAVERAELLASLDSGLAAPLTLVVAPAGSGKTVLLAQWALSRRDARVGWLDLTPADDDPAIFMRKMIAEVRTLHPMLSDLEVPAVGHVTGLGEEFLEGLATALIDVRDQIILIFDDLHQISSSQVLTDLWRLIDLMPSNVHVVFSSRVDLRLGWSRHRLQHNLVELRQAQLAFDVGSATELLERITARPVEPATAETVVAHTEGWAAGIQLAALSLRPRSSAADIVVALAEGDRLAIDYLSEEVLDALSPERRDALLRLSVLEEVNPSLAEAVAGVADGSTFLRDLETESMFVVAVGSEPDHYRFHHLFRDVLRYRLRAVDADAESDLLAVAAEWCRRNGQTSTAIEYLLEAKRWDEAMDLILSKGQDVYESGETATVARLLAKIPTDIRAARVEAELLYGMVEGFSGRAARTEEVHRGLLLDPVLPVGAQLVARAFIAGCVQFRPHAERYLEQGRRMLELAESAPDAELPDLLHLTSFDFLTALATASIGRAHFFLGDATEGRVWLERVLDSAGGAYGPYRVHVLGSLALIDAWQGRLTRAEELADEALELARELSLLAHAAPADAYLARALVAVQRGEPEVGAFALHEGYMRAASNARTQLMWVAHAISKLVDPEESDFAAGRPPGPPPPVVSLALTSISRRALRVSGRPALPDTGTRSCGTTFEDVAGMLTTRDLHGARTRLDDAAGREAASPIEEVELGILKSWLASLEGRQSETRRRLTAALDVADREGLVYPFIRAGQPVIDLVRALPGSPTDFRRTVVDRFHPTRDGRQDPLVEPLTARELELLEYLPSRLTNAELAARCFVSVNTVKTHMAHIYRKLGAAGRDAAIARARELGLLSPTDIARVG